MAVEGVGLVAAVQQAVDGTASVLTSSVAKKSGELKNWSRVTDV